jgi:hypothetical protein
MPALRRRPRKKSPFAGLPLGEEPSTKVTARRIGRKGTLLRVSGPGIKHVSAMYKGRGIGATARVSKDTFLGTTRVSAGVRKVGRGSVKKKRK